MINTLLNECKNLNINLSDTAIKNFEKFSQIMLSENEKYNLTAIKEPTEIAVKHFADSLSPLTTGLLFPGARIIDIGCGAGFPSFPLKFAMDSLEILQLDSLLKRVNFLNMVKDELSLSGISAIHGRAEEFANTPNYRESFDIAISRAVANLPALLEFCLPFVKVGGYFIAMKGNNFTDELAASQKAANTLGGTFIEVKEAFVGNGELCHNLIIFKKTQNTPSKYPRRGSKITKNPIL